MIINLYVSVNGTSDFAPICEIDAEKVEEMMMEYIEENHPELQPLDDDILLIVPDDI
jgi:hypothetical protein|tara:strand:+ start:1055 stop:1225 length:171 start_codon:yes stop_codon:yes gene_type:complete